MLSPIVTFQTLTDYVSTPPYLSFLLSPSVRTPLSPSLRLSCLTLAAVLFFINTLSFLF